MSFQKQQGIPLSKIAIIHSCKIQFIFQVLQCKIEFGIYKTQVLLYYKVVINIFVEYLKRKSGRVSCEMPFIYFT
jgi:hypothetical protein